MNKKKLLYDVAFMLLQKLEMVSEQDIDTSVEFAKRFMEQIEKK